MKKYTVHIIWAVVAIAALAGGFFWGKAAAGSARLAYTGGTAGGANSSTRRGTFAAGGGLTTGQITAIDSSSITLQLPNGNSEIVFYSSSTPVSEPTTVSPSTLKTGSNIVVTGSQNSDGSITAQTIQVRTGNAPGGFGGPGGSGGPGAGTGTGSTGQ